jgi:hypothetical protein
VEREHLFLVVVDQMEQTQYLIVLHQLVVVMVEHMVELTQGNQEVLVVVQLLTLLVVLVILLQQLHHKVTMVDEHPLVKMVGVEVEPLEQEEILDQLEQEHQI